MASLALAAFACSASSPSDGQSTSSSSAATACNPSHHHPLCPAEGDSRWCDCVPNDPCVQFGCPTADLPFCDAKLGCVQCTDDWSCKSGSGGGSSSGGPYCEPKTKTCMDCYADSQCGYPGETCLPATHECGCASDASCAGTLDGNRCLPRGDRMACGCASDADCGAGKCLPQGVCQ